MKRDVLPTARVRFRVIKVDDEQFPGLVHEDMSHMEITVLNACSMQRSQTSNDLDSVRNMSMANEVSENAIIP